MEPVIGWCSPLEVEPLIAAARGNDLTFCRGTEFIGAKVDGRLVGMGGIVWHSRHCKFKNAFVLPEYRRRGIMRALIDARLAAARARGCRYVDATCTAMSLPEFLSRGAMVTRRYKRFTGVRIHL